MEILILLALILVNGVFSMSEMALVSSRKTRLQQWADEGRLGAQAALDLANSPARFLSTVQVGITMIGILSGAFGEAALAGDLAAELATIPELAPHAQTIATTLVVGAITYLSLIIGELVPKQLALHNPEMIASFAAAPMKLLSKAASPLVKLLTLSTDLVLRAVRARPSDEPPVTHEEIKVMIEQGTEAGVFEKNEQAIVHNVFRLDDQSARAIMVPRVDIRFVDLDDPPDDIRREIVESRHSKLPVCRGGIENVIGIVHAKDLLVRALGGGELDVAAAVRPPLFIPETVSSMELLQTFRSADSHTALLVDEYGEIQGLVTLDDVLEAIVGDIQSPAEAEQPEAVRREDGSWLVDGGMSVDKLKEMFDIDELPDEDSGDYHTVAGFVMNQLGSVPKASEFFLWNGLRFEVVDMDRNRIDKVLVARSPVGEIVEF